MSSVLLKNGKLDEGLTEMLFLTILHFSEHNKEHRHSAIYSHPNYVTAPKKKEEDDEEEEVVNDEDELPIAKGIC